VILCGTGHRPDKLGGYGQDVFDRLVDLASAQLEVLKPHLVISGMALSWDQALARAACECAIPFHAYVPFPGMHQRWPGDSQKFWHALMHSAEKVITCSEEPYAGWKMQVRNERMVDASDLVLALWDGSSGGTSNCVGYANRKGVEIINVWDEWREMNGLRS
jgi:uncharacterized phage-like protein YoqJ